MFPDLSDFLVSRYLEGICQLVNLCSRGPIHFKMHKNVINSSLQIAAFKSNVVHLRNMLNILVVELNHYRPSRSVL